MVRLHGDPNVFNKTLRHLHADEQLRPLQSPTADYLEGAPSEQGLRFWPPLSCGKCWALLSGPLVLAARLCSLGSRGCPKGKGLVFLNIPSLSPAWPPVLGTRGGLWNQGRHTRCRQQERLGASFLEKKEEDRGVPAPTSRGWQTVIRLLSKEHVRAPQSNEDGGQGRVLRRSGRLLGRRGAQPRWEEASIRGRRAHVCRVRRQGWKMDRVHSCPTGSGKPWKDLARVVTGFEKAPTP